MPRAFILFALAVALSPLGSGCSEKRNTTVSESTLPESTRPDAPSVGQNWQYSHPPAAFGGILQIVGVDEHSACGTLYLVRVRDLTFPGQWFQTWVTRSALEESATAFNGVEAIAEVKLSPGSRALDTFDESCSILRGSVAQSLEVRDALRMGHQTAEPIQ